MRITRRRFVTRSAQWVGAATILPGLVRWSRRVAFRHGQKSSALARIQPAREIHQPQGSNPPFAATDFELIEELGFNFVRLPMSYLCWGNAQEPLQLREPELKHIDDAVSLGRKHHLHVNLNFHRAPGYCVNPPKEPLICGTTRKPWRRAVSIGLISPSAIRELATSVSVLICSTNHRIFPAIRN